jgi:hypothetical protein
LLCEALKRGLHGFALVMETRRYGVIAVLRKRSREASLCIYCFTECSRETLVLGFWVALSIERRVCGFLSECLDVNGMFYQAH